ncbi:MAG: PAS domain-containing hybrid sensor histidine kinase/response regulator [Mizugakiibacter sp.]|uniref:hybrid sensor histidine kinase/response regulator n=1 Tax=Mizugakiibacter sp. TaxID=1972610 RepID=UPI0031C4325A|nr:PAS-domain containing protein [Xanthomonadaceae bacterium]
MIAGWLLLLVSLAYVGLLFGVAYYGDRRPLYPSRPFLRPIVYSLALAVYCSSWTFYGAVGSAARSGLSYLPIYLGPILLFVFGIGLLERLNLIAKERGITSIADYIAARFGKSQGLGALVTLIAVVAAIPYIALQFKAVAMSIGVLSHGSASAAALPIGDSAFWCALLLAAFAILFGTRQIDATEHHHGMMLAIAVESVVKLVAFVAIGVYALRVNPHSVAELGQSLRASVDAELPSGFFAKTLLAFCAMFCLPRQFQVGVVECEDARDVRRARWVFPLYLLLICVLVPPIVSAGAAFASTAGLSPDARLLWLPLANGQTALALMAYIGGFSAATGMVIVESVALATMISNDLVMPALLRIRALKLEQRRDLSAVVLAVRRIAIVLLALLAYGYYRASTHAEYLATLGLLAFVAVAQFAPAIVSALYWRGASRIGVIAGLAAGFAVWTYTLLLPSVATAGWLPDGWVERGPFGLDWLKPQALFHLSGWDAVTHGTFWSLLANVGCMVFLSLRYRPSVDERLRALAFLDPYAARRSGGGEFRGRVRVDELRAIAGRIVGERAAARAFDEYAQARGRPLPPAENADRALIQATERLLAGAVGAPSARRMLTSALSGSGLDIAETVALLDEASQELRFNRELLSTTMENIAQGISVVDRDLRLVAWNRRYLELLGYPDGMVYVGRPVADLIRWNAERGECGPGDAAAHVDKRINHLRAGAPHVFRRERADGSVIEMRGRSLPGGGYVTTYTDVTAYKRAEQALIDANETLEQRVAQRTAELTEALTAQERAKREAEQANQSKTRFLAAASHDLLQPLNAARLFTSALRHSDLDAEAAQLAERIDASFKAAEDLLEALLDASRLEAGKFAPEVGPVALGELFESLRTQFAVLAEQRGLSLHAVDTHLAVRSDAQLLRRILQNFLSNALRYTRRGTVLLGARRHGAEVRIEVWDTGPGIAPEQQQRIFGEFQRLEHPSPWGEKGLGLGLAICERMATMLGHRLDLRSWPGRGSCFAVSAPRAAASRPLGVRAVVRPTPAGQDLPLDVLCLDNDRAILDGMAALLSRWGVSAHLAASVDAAEAILAARRVDLILADYHLGADLDGLAALARLRARWPDLPPAALITADGSAELKQRARALGYPVLHKPVKPAALRALLTALARGVERGPAAAGRAASV